MNETMLAVICWSLYSMISIFMSLFPVLIGSLAKNTCDIPIPGNIWLYADGGIQFILFAFFFPFCLDTYMYYCTDTQNTIPKILFRVSLLGTTISSIIGVGWGVLGAYMHPNCIENGLMTRSIGAMSGISIIVYTIGSIILIGLDILELGVD